MTEAVEIFGRLAERLPAAYGERLRAARGTMAGVLDALGRVEEAAEIRRDLADGGT